MKLTPSSTARRKTFFAFSRSGGQPQIPSPVNRIAPKPSRLTNRSPPNKNVSPDLLALLLGPLRQVPAILRLELQLHRKKSLPKTFSVSPIHDFRILAGPEAKTIRK